MTPEIELVAREAARRYAAELPLLTRRYGTCFEAAAIIAAVARGQGVAVDQRIGLWQAPGGTAVLHAWCEIDGLALHSPRRGEIIVETLSSRFAA